MADDKTLAQYLAAVDRAIRASPLQEDWKALLPAYVKEQATQALELIARDETKNLFRAPESTRSEEHYRSKVVEAVMHNGIGPFLYERGVADALIRDISRLVYRELGGKAIPQFEVIGR